MANNLRLRKNVDGMSSDELAATRDAYAKMMKIRASDPRSWAAWAGMHGYPQGLCWHHSRVFNGMRTFPYNLFVPWHRAYLISFEHNMRDQNPDASLPWWDWTKGTVPRAFDQPEVNGRPNSLFQAPDPAIPNRQPAGPTRRFPGENVPFGLPTQAQVDALLALTSFVDFSNQLENLHDQVHGWTGGARGGVAGDMSQVRASAFDPIFWSHHCMIDRLWYLWQQKHGLNNIPTNYLGRPLAPFQLRVEDVLDIHVLGYEYASSSARIRVEMPQARAAGAHRPSHPPAGAPHSMPLAGSALGSGPTISAASAPSLRDASDGHSVPSASGRHCCD
jgi:tyrosinase